MRVYSTVQASTEPEVEPRRRMRAADVPEVLTWDSQRTHLGYSMLIKEWHWWPADRRAMIADPPVCDNHDDLCRIAAVVHALCDKDKVPVPDWVFDYRSAQPLAMLPRLPTAGVAWERVVAEACDACEVHNVWFSRRDIESLPEAAKRIKKARRFGRWRRLWQR